MPGRRTLPVTSTTTSATGGRRRRTGPPRCGTGPVASARGARGATASIRLGRSRSTHHAVTARADARRARRAPPAGPGPSATRPRQQPGRGDHAGPAAAGVPAGHADHGDRRAPAPRATAPAGRAAAPRPDVGVQVHRSAGSSRRTAPSSALSSSSRRDDGVGVGGSSGRMAATLGSARRRANRSGAAPVDGPRGSVERRRHADRDHARPDVRAEHRTELGAPHSPTQLDAAR